jgi:hypothetical protein
VDANCNHLEKGEITLSQHDIEKLIITVRGVQVMIDRDLAMLYGVETKRLNEQVKRNVARFPERYRLQLTREEMTELVANCDRFKTLKHSTTTPFAFTEYGVSMLPSVLSSQKAIDTSIRIIMVTGDRFLSPWFLSPSMIMIFCLFINFILLVTLINQYQFLAFV